MSRAAELEDSPGCSCEMRFCRPRHQQGNHRSAGVNLLWAPVSLEPCPRRSRDPRGLPMPTSEAREAHLPLGVRRSTLPVCRSATRDPAERACLPHVQRHSGIDSTLSQDVYPLRCCPGLRGCPNNCLGRSQQAMGRETEAEDLRQENIHPVWRLRLDCRSVDSGSLSQQQEFPILRCGFQLHQDCVVGPGLGGILYPALQHLVGSTRSRFIQ